MNTSLLNLLLIGGGGFVGSVLRFLVSSWAQHRSGSAVYPFGTMTVNLIGCLLIGFLSALADNRSLLPAEARSLLIIGVLGGFTTFSSFANETMNLLRDGKPELAMLNAASQVLLGVGMVWLGRVMAGILPGQL
ncbi:fluoride efflux transporter CrcB [Desulfobulbus sp. F4]|nr:fluoride efflux transporter CrcB [Desulfobulbus sp. F4]